MSLPRNMDGNFPWPEDFSRGIREALIRDAKRLRVNLPAPAYYSDEVTDEHLNQIAELVDQDQFEDAEEMNGPAW